MTKDTINSMFEWSLRTVKADAERYDKLLSFVACNDQSFKKVHTRMVDASSNVEQALSKLGYP